MTTVRAAFLLSAVLCAQPLSAAVTGPANLDLPTVTNAHYRAHHLIGNCLAAPSQLRTNGAAIEASIRVLESLALTRSVAGDYRQSIAKIEEGARHYDEARRSTGRRRSQFVELGNQAMRAAKALLDLAVQAFNAIQPQLVKLFAASPRHAPRNEDEPPEGFPIEINPGPFRDCLDVRSDPKCCNHNYEAGLAVLRVHGDVLTPNERAAILRCLNGVLERCRANYERGKSTFLKRNWEDCFKPFFKFKYGQ